MNNNIVSARLLEGTEAKEYFFKPFISQIHEAAKVQQEERKRNHEMVNTNQEVCEKNMELDNGAHPDHISEPFDDVVLQYLDGSEIGVVPPCGTQGEAEAGSAGGERSSWEEGKVIGRTQSDSDIGYVGFADTEQSRSSTDKHPATV